MAHIEKRRRRSKSTGELGPPQWRARYVDPSGRERSKTFAKKAEAEAYLTRMESAKQRGEYHDHALGRETVGQFFERRWLPRTRLVVRPSTLALMELQWRLYVEPSFAKRRLSSITPFDVRTFVDEIAQSRSVYTAETALRTLRSILSAAVEDGLLSRSPADAARAPKRPRAEVNYLTPEQIGELVAALPEEWRAFVLVSAYGGLRFGEVTGLRTNKIDFLRRTVRVDEAIVEVRGELHPGPTKNRAARLVTLPKFVIEVLAEHVRKWPPAKNGLVFTGDDGRPVRRSNWYKRVWWPALRVAGLSGVRFHDLRHTSAALAIAAGAHPKTLQSRLGHHSAAFTLDVYGGLFEGLDGELAERLDELGQGASKPKRQSG